jgi:hypothetical protein
MLRKTKFFFLNVKIIALYDLIEIVTLTTNPYVNKQPKIGPQMVT